MIIKNLEIKNIFNHPYSNIRFYPGINLIVGPNGSGKTSIVESIALALFLSSSKAKLRNELLLDMVSSSSIINLEIGDIIIHRDLVHRERDWLRVDDKNITGRDNITKEIEILLNISREFFQNIIYSPQDKLLNVIDLTPSEREKIINKILKIDYITDFAKLLNRIINQLNSKKSEVSFLLKRIEASKEERKREILEEAKRLEEKLKEIKKEKEILEQKKLAIEAQKLIKEKEKWLKEYWNYKKLISKYYLINKKIENIKNILIELKEAYNLLTIRKKEKEDKIEKLKNLIKNGICSYCERKINKSEMEKYEENLINEENNLVEIITNLQEAENKIKQLNNKLESLKREKNKINKEKILSQITRLKYKSLQVPSKKKLEEIIKNTPVKEKEGVIFKKYEEILKLYEELSDHINKLKWEYKTILNKRIKEEKEILHKRISDIDKKINKLEKTKKVITENNLAHEIRWGILKQTQIEEIFKIFELGDLSFNKELEFFINNLPIRLGSGAQKVAAAIAIKLAFLNLQKTNFLILDEPTMFLDKKRINDLMLMLETIYQRKFVKQIILISHEEAFKEIANNIIEVKRNSEGKAEIFQYD